MENKIRTKQHSNRIKILFVIVCILILILIFFVDKIFTKNSNIATDNITDFLVGNWTIDGITNYEFDGKGEGKLKLPKNEYSFNYTIENSKIHLDYKDEEATDSDYEYSFKDDELILKGINSTSGTYELNRIIIY